MHRNSRRLSFVVLPLSIDIEGVLKRKGHPESKNRLSTLLHFVYPNTLWKEGNFLASFLSNPVIRLDDTEENRNADLIFWIWSRTRQPENAVFLFSGNLKDLIFDIEISLLLLHTISVCNYSVIVYNVIVYTSDCQCLWLKCYSVNVSSF